MKRYNALRTQMLTSPKTEDSSARILKRWSRGFIFLGTFISLLFSSSSSGILTELSAIAQVDPCSPSGSSFVCKITFDELPDSTVLSPLGTVIKEQYKAKAGVLFPNGAWVVKPKKGTKSGQFALINASSDGQLEFNAFPLKIEFADNVKVKRVKMHIGLDKAIKGMKPTLAAFDSAGALRAAVNYTPVVDGPTEINRAMEISVPTGTLIKRVELQYGGDSPDAKNAVEVIDDLEFETEGTVACLPSADTQAPKVKITQPKDGETLFTQNLSHLAGMVSEDSGKLSDLFVVIKGAVSSYTVNLSSHLLPDTRVSGLFRFALDNLGLFEGSNQIIVLAADGACPSNRDGEIINVNVQRPPADLNVYAMAIEITQAIQDQLQIREVTSEGSDKTLFRLIPYAGVPLVANKRTVVRVYAEVVKTPGVTAIHGVPAMLIARRGGKETRLTAPSITIDPADQVDKSDGTRDVGQTLEKKRADIKKSWNFVLSNSLTDEGPIDELEVIVNPTELSGPQECLGCNDAANRLTVAKILFQKIPPLGIKSYYVLGDGKGAGEDVGIFCSGFQKMYPLQEGCGSSPINGVNLLSLAQETKKDDKGNLTLDRGTWQPEMCDRMKKEKGSFTTPAAYYAIGPDGLAGAPGNGIQPAACAAGPAGSGEYPYSVAAQEIGHGDFTSRAFSRWWHPCGPGELAEYPKYKNAKGDEYYKGSIGQFGLDTSNLVVKNPQTLTDFMGYTYCDQYISALDASGNKLTIKAYTGIKIGETPTSLSDLIMKGVGGELSARGLTFKLEAFTPATAARAFEATILISGTSKAGDLYIQIDNRPLTKVTLVDGQSTDDVRKALSKAIIALPGSEFFAAGDWVSPFTYRLIFDQFISAAHASFAVATSANDREAQGSQREYLFASGQMDPKDQVTLDPFYWRTLPIGTSDEPGVGAYSLELQNQNGQVLFVRRFDLTLPHHDVPQIRHFNEILPFVSATARIIFKQGDKALATRVISANTPKVTLVAPNGGESWDASGAQIIQWTASDADQDMLFYIVEYSKDGGQTWRTLAIDLTETKLTVDTALLPGSEKALVRVSATDGVNTGQDQSDATFKVAKKEPRIFITGLNENAVVEAGSVLNLQANIIDPDEDPIDEKTIVWSSDKASVLGTGTRLEVNPDQLQPGAHKIVLSVPGDQGNLITQSVSILRAPLFQEVPSSSPLVLNAQVTVDKVCGDNITHEIKIGWNVSGAQSPVQAFLEIINPAGVKQDRTLSGLAGTAKFSVSASGGGTRAVKITVKDALGTTAFALANPDLLPVSVLSVNPATLSFSGDTGRANPSAQRISIANSNAGNSTLNWNAVTDASWLSVSPASGAAPAMASVAVNTANLAAGIYQGKVTITDVSPPNCFTQIPVTLTLTAIATLTVNAIAEGLATAPGSINLPMTVTTPSGTETRTTPFEFTLVQGLQFTLQAPATAAVNGRELQFVEWRSNQTVLTSQTQLTLTVNNSQNLTAVYRLAATLTLTIISICEGCATGPIQFSGAQINVSSPPLGNRPTPFNIDATPRSRLTITASSTASASGRALQFVRWRSITDNRDLTTSPTLSGTVDKAETLAAVYQAQGGGGTTQVTLTVESRRVNGQLLNMPIQVINPAQGTRTTTFQITLTAGASVSLRAPKYANGSDQCNTTVCPPQFVRWRVGGQTITTSQQVTTTVNQTITLVAEYQ